jgi:FtsP/CotA-like multicopper oxidase with cupredoxin domain
MWTRRQFVTIGTMAGLGVVTGCSRGGSSTSSSSVPSSLPPLGGRVPDVRATYTAGPMRWSILGEEVATWGYESQLPGPLLRATAGDLVEVTLVNQLSAATSVHWHGLAIVNAMDGVPAVTQPDIEPGSQFTYLFTVPDAGTYWFHPHHGLQLERGLYAPFVIDDPDEHVAADVDYVIVLDDWLDGAGTTPEQEYDRIRAAGMEMGDMGDMSEMDHGSMGMATSPLLGGDAGDARHPYHLINGRPLDDPATLEPLPRPGDRVRLRFINASADTAYRVAVGGHRLTVTHTDGFPVVPVEVDAFLIGMGERYDVTVDVQSGSWPIIAVAEGKDQRAGAILRTSDTNARAAITFEAAELDGTWLRYADLAAHERARLTPTDDITEIDLALTGGMAMTDWGINGDRYGEHEPIEVEHGRWYSLNIVNETTMWHPIHVHGHTPQLGRAAGGVRKDTVNVLPGATVELVFQANNPGDWMLHCHNAYHLEAGMATLLRYRNGE